VCTGRNRLRITNPLRIYELEIDFRNMIEHLFKEKYIIDLFKREVLPKFPGFSDIRNIEIIPHKKFIWEKSYHVVVEFKTVFIEKNGKEKTVPIFCSAHSEEPRENIFKALSYLWDNGFADDIITIPRPLFYSKVFRGTFYRGVEGRNLYQFIREGNKKEIEKIIPQAAVWFAKLHKLPVKGAENLNEANSRIRTVLPGRDHLLESIKESYPDYYTDYKTMYDIFITAEEEFLNREKRHWVIHGDAHPENIIKVSDNEIGAIDFTDMSVADLARDLGCFLQQLEYMAMRKIGDQEYTEKIKKLFLDNYVKNAKIEIDESLLKRIDIYYNWTAIRTATFFLLKVPAEFERAKALIQQTVTNMKL